MPSYHDFHHANACAAHGRPRPNRSLSRRIFKPCLFNSCNHILIEKLNFIDIINIDLLFNLMQVPKLVFVMEGLGTTYHSHLRL
jgi:hypothetical protein